MRTIGCGLFRKRIPARRALSTFRGCSCYQHLPCITDFSATKRPPTSTSSRTVSTNRSSSEFRHPTITPGDEDRGRSYGQNTRNSPSLMSMLSSFTRFLERASTAQLFSRGDAVVYVPRVLLTDSISACILAGVIRLFVAARHGDGCGRCSPNYPPSLPGG